MDGHLLALAEVTGVAVALVAELVEREAAVHEHSWTDRLHWLHRLGLHLVEGRSLQPREQLCLGSLESREALWLGSLEPRAATLSRDPLLYGSLMNHSI